jgi:uncharacterized membrane protein
VLLIFLAPYLYNIDGLAAKYSSYIYLFFSETCHQLDSRSFTLWGYKLAVCSRCTVIYISFLLSVILYPFIWKLKNEKLPNIYVLLIPAFLVFADVFFDLTGILKNTFVSRIVTGFLIGFVLPMFLIPGFINLFKGFYKIFNK